MWDEQRIFGLFSLILQQEVAYRKGACSVIFIIFWCVFVALFGHKAEFQSADYSTCLACILQQLSTSVSVKVVDVILTKAR